MQRALVDTGVMYAAFDRRDTLHETGLAVVRDADRSRLPELVVLDVVLAETMNALTQRLQPAETVEALESLETSVGFTIERTVGAVWARGRSVFERRAKLSYVDSLLVAYALERELEYLYSFDTGFDDVDEISRLNTNVNPYRP